MSAGSYIDVDILLGEIERYGVQERVWIDPLAMVVRPEHGRIEQDLGLGSRIGSTQSGTGAAVIERVSRGESVILARDDARLRPFLRVDAKDQLVERLAKRQRIVIEGTQGFGLSLLHGSDYPKVTSRDTTAAAFLAETGLSPLDVDQIVLVIRTFPIRVAGNSGPLAQETTWEEIARESGSDVPLQEFTTVTKRVRRVAHFTPDVVVRAIKANNPSHVVMNHLDYVDARCHCGSSLTPRARRFIEMVESQIGRSIDLVGAGANNMHVVARLKLAANG